MNSQPSAAIDDDAPIGRILTRREVLALGGSIGVAAFLAACSSGTGATASLLAPAASPSPSTTGGSSGMSTSSATAASSPLASGLSCIVRPAETEGPYFVDEKLNRSDIRTDPADGSATTGVLFALTFAVYKVTGAACSAFEGALVDVWHCDALGVYSDVSAQSTVGHKYLRGYQVADVAGLATFKTIYPGWYSGRAVHIHIKIRTDPSVAQGLEFTSQLFFDEAVTDRVHALVPYSQMGTRDTKNSTDSVYSNGGDQLLVALTGDPTAGYATTFPLGVQAS